MLQTHETRESTLSHRAWTGLKEFNSVLHGAKIFVVTFFFFNYVSAFLIG